MNDIATIHPGESRRLAAPVVIGTLVEWTGHYEAGFLFMALSAVVSASLVMALRGHKP